MRERRRLSITACPEDAAAGAGLNVIRALMNRSTLSIEPYDPRPAACVEHDPLAAQVATRVAQALCARMPSLTVEHVGSTAVPGCAGKGIIDLAVFYPPAELVAARATVDGLGFQRQPHRDPFPEERPMRVGAITHAGRKYFIHVHVIAQGSAEAHDLIRFRDRLRSDASLREAYVARKRAILAAGTSDSLDYSKAKERFIASALNVPR